MKEENIKFTTDEKRWEREREREREREKMLL